MTNRPRIGKIMCAVDFSEHSVQTLAEAVNLAEMLRAELVVVNVVNERLFEDLERYQGRLTVLEGVVDKAYETLQDRAVDKLKQLLGEVDASKVDHHSHVSVGIPWEKILELAQKEEVDLIVMGAHGRGSLVRQLRFGSTAEKVFRRAKCRVLFTR